MATLQEELFQAINNYDIETVKSLIAAGADVNAKDNNGYTPLYTCIYGILYTFRQHFKRFAENTYPSAKDDLNKIWPCNHCDSNDVKIAKLLIAAGADVNAKIPEDIYDRTLLYTCCTLLSIRYSAKCAQLLISAGADVNAKDNTGKTPLHICTYPETAKVFIDAGADVNAKDSDGQTPLHMHTEPFYSFAPNTNINAEIIKILIDAGADVNAKDRYGQTPLHTCTDPQTLQLLIDAGADVNANNNAGQTPMFTCRGPKTIKQLIKAGADVNAKDNEGLTPIYTCKDVKTAKVLIKAGADINIKENFALTPLYICRGPKSAKRLIHNKVASVFKDMDGCYRQIQHALAHTYDDIMLDHRINHDMKSNCIVEKICRADGRCCTPVFEVVYDIPESAFDETESVRIVLPIHDLPPQMRILWGDEPDDADWNVIKIDANNPVISHDYTKPGKYHVQLLDSDVTWEYDDIEADDEFDDGDIEADDDEFDDDELQTDTDELEAELDNDGRQHLVELVSFGNIRLGNNAFQATGLLKLPADDVPDSTKLTTLNSAFANTPFNAPIPWDTSRVEDMSGMFAGAKAFNQPLNFDTSNVKNMSGMFAGAKAFNQPLNFDTSNVKYMSGMFCGAKSFNQPLNFDTSNVKNMSGMFCGAKTFNQPINFDTSNVIYMEFMFSYAKAFSQPLNINTKSVMDMSGMFCGAIAFNQPLNFDTKSVTDMSGMFWHAHAFNQPLNFDISNVKYANTMFWKAHAFIANKTQARNFYEHVKTVHEDIIEHDLFGRNLDNS